jgi:uncharacterized protein (DUF427 family)
MTESVWDYPRPPRLEAQDRHVRIMLAGAVLADTRSAFRVLETSHPPVFYIPRADIAAGALEPSSGGGSYCEWKGSASYLDVIAADGRRLERAAWTYPSPTAPFAAIAGTVAFYPSRMDECTVDGEIVQSQEGDFYGGWITSEIVGPFKGGPGTFGW